MLGLHGGGESGADHGGSSYTVRGKIRSLQDALQTLLRHTALLLSDIDGYTAAGQSAGSAAADEEGEGESGNDVALAASTPRHWVLAVQAAALMAVSRISLSFPFPSVLFGLSRRLFHTRAPNTCYLERGQTQLLGSFSLT